MPDPVLQLDDLHKNFGGLVVTDGVTLDIGAGELHAVIGPNGAGKTTLINQISGLLAPTAGTIRFDGIDVTALPVDKRAQLGLARSFQITSVLPRFSALENFAGEVVLPWSKWPSPSKIAVSTCPRLAAPLSRQWPRRALECWPSKPGKQSSSTPSKPLR